jgi:hypothetical protein
MPNLKFTNLSTCQMRQFKAKRGDKDFQRCADCEGAELLPDAPEIEVREPVVIPHSKSKTKETAVMQKTKVEIASQTETIICSRCKKPILTNELKPDGTPYRMHRQCREKFMNQRSEKKEQLPPKPKKSPYDLCHYLEIRLEDLKRGVHDLEHEISVTEAAYNAALSARTNQASNG